MSTIKLENITYLLRGTITCECYYFPPRLIYPTSHSVNNSYFDIVVTKYNNQIPVGEPRVEPRFYFDNSDMSYELKDDLFRILCKDYMTYNDILGGLNKYIPFDQVKAMNMGFVLTFDNLSLKYMPDNGLIYIIRNGYTTKYENLGQYVIDNKMNSFKYSLSLYVKYDNEKVFEIYFDEEIEKMS